MVDQQFFKLVKEFITHIGYWNELCTTPLFSNVSTFVFWIEPSVIEIMRQGKREREREREMVCIIRKLWTLHYNNFMDQNTKKDVNIYPYVWMPVRFYLASNWVVVNGYPGHRLRRNTCRAWGSINHPRSWCFQDKAIRGTIVLVGCLPFVLR